MTADRAALQRKTLPVLVASPLLGGAAIGVGAAVSPLLAKEILDGDGTLAGVAFAFPTLGAALAATPTLVDNQRPATELRAARRRDSPEGPDRSSTSEEHQVSI